MFREILFQAILEIHVCTLFTFRVNWGLDIQLSFIKSGILHPLALLTLDTFLHLKLETIARITCLLLFLCFCDLVQEILVIFHCILLLSSLELGMSFTNELLENLWPNSILIILIRHVLHLLSIYLHFFSE